MSPSLHSTTPRQRSTRSLLGGAANYVWRALPPWRTALVGALLWALAMGASALLGLLLDDWETPAKIREVSVLFATGGVVAFPIGLFIARLLSLRRRPEVVFAATFVCLTAATIGFTSGLYALQYRSYYSEWHAAALTFIWFIQFAYTVASALYQFTVLGIRLYFPLGFAALFLAGFWFARQQR